MKRLGFVLWIWAVAACSNGKEKEAEENGAFNYSGFSNHFTASKLPYVLTDSGLLKNEDTAGLRNAAFTAFIPDSVKQKLAGKAKTINYIPLAKIEVPKGESYFIVKTKAGNRTAALLAVFDKNKNYSAAFPFLLPDADAATNQVSSIDRAYSISRNVSRKTKDDVLIEGKDVYVFNEAAKGFTLIMTDVLDDSKQALINPIDTFSKQHPLAGDYIKDKKNIVSIRDGRNPNELMMFVHFEKNDGECNGELKGSLLMTSSKTAVFRQGGDPCVLEFNFGTASVTLREVEGCGSHRDMTCVFEGTFPRKKVEKPKSESKKTLKR